MNTQSTFTLALRIAALGLLPLAGAWAQKPAPAASARVAPVACPAILKHQFPRLQDDAPQNLCQYAGKVVLVVNTASFCGFTKQYEGLESLYAKYQGEGLVVLGFPSNEFGEQEPGSAKEIADFCFNTYGVKFPMFAKTEVKGPKKNALYVELAKSTQVEPKWNFNKYLIDRSGKVLAHYPSNVEPQSSTLVLAVEKALGPQ
jgi:glutathione peroxidase